MSLAEQDIYIGPSSWKYEGWMGKVYTPERYLTRGRFSKSKFEETCLEEFAENFPIVCGDFSFYQFPSEAYWHKLFSSAPATLRYAFKVPEDITCKKFPKHLRYGQRAGQQNPEFLNAELFTRNFLDLLEPYGDQVALLIFEFGTFSTHAFENVHEFLEQLAPFLASLPPRYRYAVEIRNDDYLSPAYCECLRAHRVAHVFNAWTRMPDLATQISIDEAFTSDFVVTRAMLRQGRTFEEGVAKFSPYKEIQDPYPEARDAIRTLIRRAQTRKELAFFFVSNRLEGSAPSTIEAIVEEIDA
jgi:uncharacterized protein YecE (DUF72 family)